MRIQLLIISLFVVASLAAQDSEWTLKKDQSGIKIYTKQSENSKLQTFKAIATFNCPYQNVINTLRDYEHFSDWMYSIEEAEVFVDEEGYDIIYQETDLPWPCDNRDVTMNRIFKKTKKGMRIELKTQDDFKYKSQKKGVTRMTKASGSWDFTTLADGRTEVIYQFLGDPGGKIPTWVVNLFMVEGPYKTLLNIRDKSGCNPE